MSEREDFKAWLKTWAFPGNTSREDAMFAAWQARAARTAPAEQAEGTRSDKYRAELYDEVWQKARDMGYGNVTNALVALERLNQARAALHADNERLRDDVERLQSENQSLLMQCTGMGNSIDELKRSLQNEVNRRNQYAMESDELDKQVEALTNSNKACEDCFIEMRAERDALKADAERYRWLRNPDTDPAAVIDKQVPWVNLDGDTQTIWEYKAGEELDAAIDAARTAKPEEGCPLCNGDCSAANPPVTNCPLDASAKPEVKS